MPPRGSRPGSKRARRCEHVKESELDRGVSEGRAEEIAARTVNRERARVGEAKTASRLSRTDISFGRRGGLRSGKAGPRGRTYRQLYAGAQKRAIAGRSLMTKAELERAVDARRGGGRPSG